MCPWLHCCGLNVLELHGDSGPTVERCFAGSIQLVAGTMNSFPLWNEPGESVPSDWSLSHGCSLGKVDDLAWVVLLTSLFSGGLLGTGGLIIVFLCLAADYGELEHKSDLVGSFLCGYFK